jgi:carbon monoxide dehydrogenase subunit G
LKLSAAHHIQAPREKVFAAITDPSVLQKCIEGCEQMVRTGEDSYEARLRIGSAGIKGSYAGKVQMKDKKVPDSYTLLIEGKGMPGFIRSSARIQLGERDQGTDLRCDADVQVGGLIAAVGSRLVEAAAAKMIEQFFKKFAAAVESES